MQRSDAFIAGRARWPLESPRCARPRSLNVEQSPTKRRRDRLAVVAPRPGPVAALLALLASHAAASADRHLAVAVADLVGVVDRFSRSTRRDGVPDSRLGHDRGSVGGLRHQRLRGSQDRSARRSHGGSAPGDRRGRAVGGADAVRGADADRVGSGVDPEYAHHHLRGCRRRHHGHLSVHQALLVDAAVRARRRVLLGRADGVRRDRQRRAARRLAAVPRDRHLGRRL